MTPRTMFFSLASLVALGWSAAVQADNGTDKEAIAAVRKSAELLGADFNAGKADAVAARFLPQGELIDEAGTVYHGTAEITALLKAFFEKFPGAKLAADVESVRIVGPVAIEEGTRTITAKDGVAKSRFRYIAAWAKSDKGWQLASLRDFEDSTPPTAHENLATLDWLIGDWINEGADGKVAITYRWSDDKNFLLGEFKITPNEGKPCVSTHRIGWDPSTGRFRSWLFDDDGGFAQGLWTLVDDGVVIKSDSVNPDGSTASATMNIYRQDKDHFKIEGTDRIVGDALEDDFELTVTRRPTVATK